MSNERTGSQFQTEGSKILLFSRMEDVLRQLVNYPKVDGKLQKDNLINWCIYQAKNILGELDA